jgi:hypothetical protein
MRRIDEMDTPAPGRRATARPATFDRDVWCAACTLIRDHGREATAQAAKATEARLTEKDLNRALVSMLIAKAVTVLLAGHPDDGEMIH